MGCYRFPGLYDIKQHPGLISETWYSSWEVLLYLNILMAGDLVLLLFIIFRSGTWYFILLNNSVIFTCSSVSQEMIQYQEPLRMRHGYSYTYWPGNYFLEYPFVWGRIEPVPFIFRRKDHTYRPARYSRSVGSICLLIYTSSISNFFTRFVNWETISTEEMFRYNGYFIVLLHPNCSWIE